MSDSNAALTQSGISKITAGLAATSPTSPSPQIMTRQDALTAGAFGDTALASMFSHLKNASLEIEAASTEVARDVASFTSLTPEQRAVAAKDAVKAKHKHLVEKTQGQRDFVLNKLASEAAKAKASRQFYKSPITMARQHLFGTVERSRMTEQLAHAGPAELRDAANLALASGGEKGKLIMAAVLSHLGRLSPGERANYGLHHEQLANSLWGEEQREIVGSLDAVIGAHDVASAMNKSFETGEPIPPTTRIALGLRGLRVPANAKETVETYNGSLSKITRAIEEALRGKS